MTRLEATRIVVEALATIRRRRSSRAWGIRPTICLPPAIAPANFYTWGSMGLASSIGLGLALARPDCRVFVLDGDGSLLMNLGSLATIGWTQPARLVVIVWDNGLYATTGGQETATAHGADLEAAARAMGIAANGDRADRRGDCAARDRACRERAGAVGDRRQGARVAPAVKPPLDYVAIKERFMAAIGSAEPRGRGESGA